ncbi:MAG: outer membrane protein transport protein [Gemmatimonadota bacterium]|nr:outer membrane protein transport protein [Gemmatimonadota bacterium]
MSHRLIRNVAGALALAATTATAQTNGYLLPCSAAGALGRGCTTLTNPADPAMLLGNPAALTAMRGRAFSVSGAAFLPSMSFANAVNPATDGKRNVFPLPAIFYAQQMGSRWAFGLGAQTLGGMGADYTLTNAVLGPDQRYHSKFALMKGGLALAYRPVRQLSVGVMAGVLYGQLEMATPYAVSPSQLAGFAGLAQIPTYQALMSGFSQATAYATVTGLQATALSAGASVEYLPSDDWQFALMWTAPATLKLSGGAAAMDMNAQFLQLYQAMVGANGGNAGIVSTQLSQFGINMNAGMSTTFDARANFGVPQTVTLAAGARVSDRVRAGADAEWIGWAHAFRDMPLMLSGGTSANINILMNGAPTNGAFTAAWPTDWKDTWSGRAGVSFQATRALSLSVGGIYGSDPVPDGTLFAIFPAIVQGAATVGAGYQVGPAVLDLAYAHTFAHSQVAAASNLVATEYANSTSKLGENTISFGIGWKF